MSAIMANILYFASLGIMLVGAAILILDVITSFSADQCIDTVTGELVPDRKTGKVATNRDNGFFVIAHPEFEYEYDGKKYRHRSQNLFFHVFLAEGTSAVPFEFGKRYVLFVNPDDPNKFVTDGEQFFNPFRTAGAALCSVGGILWILNTFEL